MSNLKRAEKFEFTFSELADEVLLEQFRNGCELSLAEIISRYETKIYNLALRFTRNAEDAEEVFQDVFVTVFRKAEGFEGKSKFSSWLYRVTVNASFMKLRKKKQDQSFNMDDMTLVIERPVQDLIEGEDESAEDITLNTELRIRLEDSISKLPDEYRLVFLLRDIDGMPNREVAAILGISIPAVKSRLHRARLMLRRKLNRYYEDYSDSKKIVSTGSALAERAA